MAATSRDATVVVVSWNGRELLAECLPALARCGAAAVWVVDNGSTDGTAAWLRETHPQVRLLRSERNLGFAGGNNLALAQVRTPFAVLVNNDAVPADGWLAALMAGFTDAAVAAVGSKVLLGDGRLNSVGGAVDPDGYGYDLGFGQPDDGRLDEPRDVPVAPATACALRMAALAHVGFFDEAHFLYYEDTDLCWRLRLAGWRVRVAPAAVVVHRHGASTGAGRSDRHTFYDARNRLLTLVKNAPAGLAAREVLRYPLTTASLATHGQAHRARVRARAYVAFLAGAPRALARRRAVGRLAVRSRRTALGG